jgi:hypothetical protein
MISIKKIIMSKANYAVYLNTALPLLIYKKLITHPSKCSVAADHGIATILRIKSSSLDLDASKKPVCW